MANSGQIIKVSYSKGFTVIPNEIAQSKELSMEEKGLLLFLNSLPETFVIYKSNLHIIMGELEGSVDRVFKQLRAKGYIKSEKMHAENGEFNGWQHSFSLDPSELQPKATLAEVGESSPIIKKEDNTSIYIKETYPSLVSFYNNLFKRNTRGCKKSQSQYRARVKEGYKLEDFKKALTALHQDKYHQEKDYFYATLEFITRSDKLERFVNMTSNAQLTKAETDEQRYESLMQIVVQKPMDNNRFTQQEREFICAFQRSYDRFPPGNRKLVSTLSSLTRAELDQMEGKANG